MGTDTAVDTVYLRRTLSPLQEPEKVELCYEPLGHQKDFWIKLINKCSSNAQPADETNLKKIVQILESLSGDISAGVVFAYNKDNLTCIEKKSLETFMFVFSMHRFPIQLHTDVFTCPFFKADESTPAGTRVHDGLDQILHGFAAKVGLKIDPSKRLIVLPKADWTTGGLAGATTPIKGSIIDLNPYVTGRKIHFFLHDTNQTEVSLLLNGQKVDEVQNVHRMNLEGSAANLFNFFTYFPYTGQHQTDRPWTPEGVAAVSPFELAKLYDPTAEFGFVHFYAKAQTITVAGKVASELDACVKPRAKEDMTFTQ